MKKNIKQFVALGLALGLALIAPAQSLATAAKAPKHSGGIVFSDPSFIGIKAVRLDSSTTPTQLVSGQGLLYAICPDGGTLGKYTVAYDYTLSEGDNFPAAPLNNLLQDGGNATKYAISPPVSTRKLSTEWGPSGNPYAAHDCFVPPFPIRFELGLIGVNSDSGHRALFLYRLDDGSNP